MTSDDCAAFAIHDLAALADGHLSFEGTRRLTAHLRQCETCMATLAAIVDEVPVARGTRDVSEAARRAKAVLDAAAELPSERPDE
ncbi:MAG TPA: hypothetical protein VFP84_03520 [Kofleriaceae bacterium]|nr:hypothetical protein [Kofleriaceae bacterium]